VRVLGRVRERLGDDVIRRHFDRLRQPRNASHLELDRDRGPPGQRLQGRPQEQLQDGRAAVAQAADAAGAIRAWAAMQAWRNPKIAAAARALNDTRHADPAAAAAWADRTGNRMRGAVSITERLRAEGRLDPTWTTTEAAALLWELTSFRLWDDLVNDARIEPDRYVEIITAAALSTLGAPVTPPASRETPGACHGSAKADSPATR
jgi:hypothetical protein